MRNSIFSKPFLKSLFYIQNNWHQHGVFMHTLRVVWHIVLSGELRFFCAGVLHDIGKPFVAYQKDEDIEVGEYSFTDHEEASYQIIKKWFFVSQYTKNIVRYHYLIVDIEKSKTENPERYIKKKKIWDSLDKKMQDDLKQFLIYDNLGKGKNIR